MLLTFDYIFKVNISFTYSFNFTKTINLLNIFFRYSGILMGLSNSFGTISGFLAPLVVGALIENNVSCLFKSVFS